MSSDVSFGKAYQELFIKHFSHIPGRGSSNYYLVSLLNFSNEALMNPLFLMVEICLYLPDDQVAHFDLTPGDISHIRENYSNFVKGVLNFKWKGCHFEMRRMIETNYLLKLTDE